MIRVLQKLRPILRLGKHVAAKIIAHQSFLESLWVRISRRYANHMIVRSLSIAISRVLINSENPLRIVSLKSNSKMYIDASDLYFGLYFFGYYEPETTKAILQLIRPGDVIFDIGANAGYFTLLMASIVGSTGHVHSFEPTPKLAATLMRSVRMNSYEDRVTLNQVAVSDNTRRDVQFYISQDAENSGLSSLKLHINALVETDKILVDTVTLDGYIQNHDIARCDLIKIDVETAEAEVIRGMSNTLCSRRPRFVICETLLGGTADALLKEYGYLAFIPTELGLEQAQDISQFWGNLLYVSLDALSESETRASVELACRNGSAPNNKALYDQAL